MRVIAGSARRLLLKTVEGMDTRPTTDRTKETLFNMLQPRIGDCKFLDLYSGSGAIGIEALSRGASLAVMIEGSESWKGKNTSLISFLWTLPTIMGMNVWHWTIWHAQP